MAAYQQHIAQFGDKQAVFDVKTGLTRIGNLSIKEEGGKLIISGDEDYQRYEKLNADLLALDNQQRHHAGQFLALQAMARGITINRIQHDLDEQTIKQYKNSNKNLKTTLANKRQEALSGKNTLSQDEYQQLQRQGAKTTDEVIALERHDIAKQLNLNELTPEDIIFFDTVGITAVINLMLLQAGVDHASKLDETDKTKGVAKTNAQWRRSKIRLLSLIFSLLGLSIESGQGIYNKTEARKLREAILNDKELVRYILFKLRLKISSQLSDVAFANKLIRKLLRLKIDRFMMREEGERCWFYSINQVTFTQLKKYANYRSNAIGAAVCHQE
jgi:hypothetical protein